MQPLTMILQALDRLKGDYRSEYVIDFVKGNLTDDVQSHHHDSLEEFGIAEQYSAKTLGAVIRQAVIEGYIEKEVENYGVLKITKEGSRFIDAPHSFLVVEDADFNDDAYDGEFEGGTNALDPTLYNMLKSLRQETAEKRNVPAYVVFQDVSLEQMATMDPVNLDELQNIQGVGVGKAKRFGQEFCDLIRKYCDENNIERPEDIRVRTVANKSVQKISIIQNIDRQISFDVIAKAAGLSFESLIDEIEAIVYSGTKLNIDYYIEETIDDDHVDDIYDYFLESDSDSIDDAIEELGDDYPPMEIRLVRLKFISEMAN